jgi:Skp family chaperone for outer membrane proteins
MAAPSPQRPPASPSLRTPSRRRQRSVRVTVAVGLLAAATLVVFVALPTQSPLWLSFSSVFALLCGATASRIVYTELLQSRQEAAADRAAQAQAYKTMFTERAAEHAEFTSAMTDSLAARDKSIQELEGTIVLAEARAIEAETRVKRESRRANEAQELVAKLQEQLEIRKAEQADELASWEGWDGMDVETVVDLLAWEEKVQANAAESGKDDRKHA